MKDLLVILISGIGGFIVYKAITRKRKIVIVVDISNGEVLLMIQELNSSMVTFQVRRLIKNESKDKEFW